MPGKRDKVKYVLGAYLKDWLAKGDEDMATVEDVVDDILNPGIFPELAIVDRKAELPKSPEFYKDWGGESAKESYRQAQQDMLKANFRKVIDG